jgi:seryl-tRNA synthetase
MLKEQGVLIMHDEEKCYYLHDKENIISERDVLLGFIQELKADIEYKNTQEDLRLNAILTQAEKNKEQDEKIQNLVEGLNELKDDVKKISEAQTELKQTVNDLEKHMKNGFKKDLIKEFQEASIETTNYAIKTFIDKQAIIYEKQHTSKIVNWKYEVFKFIANATMTGGIVYLIIKEVFFK